MQPFGASFICTNKSREGFMQILISTLLLNFYLGVLVMAALVVLTQFLPGLIGLPLSLSQPLNWTYYILAAICVLSLVISWLKYNTKTYLQIDQRMIQFRYLNTWLLPVKKVIVWNQIRDIRMLNKEADLTHLRPHTEFYIENAQGQFFKLPSFSGNGLNYARNTQEAGEFYEYLSGFVSVMAA